MSGSVISWAICKSAPHSRQPRQHPTTQFCTGRMPFLSPLIGVDMKQNYVTGHMCVQRGAGMSERVDGVSQLWVWVRDPVTSRRRVEAGTAACWPGHHTATTRWHLRTCRETRRKWKRYFVPRPPFPRLLLCIFAAADLVITFLFHYFSFQCFDAVGLVAGRASSL